jgi:hypothetical protein
MEEDKLEQLSQNIDDLLEQLTKLKNQPIDIEFEEIEELPKVEKLLFQ